MNSFEAHSRIVSDVFPAQHILDRFAFLVDQHGYSIDSVEVAGREVDVLFRRKQIGFRIVCEWAVLPHLFIEMYHTSDSSEIKRDVQVEGNLLKKFGVEEGSFPVHSRIANAFFLKGMYLHVRHAKHVHEEVRKKIDDYAAFVQEHYDQLYEYAMHQ